jgi:hypothetical protein
MSQPALSGIMAREAEKDCRQSKEKAKPENSATTNH